MIKNGLCADDRPARHTHKHGGFVYRNEQRCFSTFDIETYTITAMRKVRHLSGDHRALVRGQVAAAKLRNLKTIKINQTGRGASGWLK